MLTFKNVHLSIDKHEILRNLNFTVEPGEVVAILGSSGAGKSSVFKLMTMEQKPTIGKIELDGMSLGDLSFDSVQDYRRQIGIIFQDYRLLNQKTVFENIAFALEVCGDEALIAQKVPELIELVGLTGKEDTFPHSLSGGEKQRVSIARALVHDPVILVADEATGNLDPRNSREISDLFLKINERRNLTIFFATHDPILVKKLKPRVIRIEKGKILIDEKNISVKRAFEGIL